MVYWMVHGKWNGSCSSPGIWLEGAAQCLGVIIRNSPKLQDARQMHALQDLELNLRSGKQDFRETAAPALWPLIIWALGTGYFDCGEHYI